MLDESELENNLRIRSNISIFQNNIKDIVQNGSSTSRCIDNTFYSSML